MTLTRLFPVGSAIDRVRVADTNTSAESDPATSLSALMTRLYEPLSGPWVRLNLITSVDGCAVGPDGTSDSLANRTDRELLKVIRSSADVIVVGAATIRAEGYRMPSSARLAIVTASGDIRGHRLSGGAAGEPLLVFCPARAADEIRRSVGDVAVEVIPLPDDDGVLRAADIVAALSARSLDRVLCEGGPWLATQFLDDGLIDEICLTTAPVITGGDTVFARLRSLRRMTLTQLLVDDAGFQFARWAVSERARPAHEPIL